METTLLNSVSLTASEWSNSKLVSLLSQYGDAIREDPHKFGVLTPEVMKCFGISPQEQHDWSLTLSYVYGVTLVLTNQNTGEVRHENGSYIV